MKNNDEIVNELNKVLDKNKIRDVNNTIDIIVKFTTSNLSKNETIKLLDKLNSTSISKFRY